MAEAAAALRLYGRLAGARIRSEWQFRTSFALLVAAQALAAVHDLAALLVIFSNIDALAGWSVAEVAVLYGINGVAFALADLMCSPAEHAATHVRRGTFDVFLVRPAGALLQLLASEFALRRVGCLVQPAAVLGVALHLTEAGRQAGDMVLVVVAVLAGAVIYGAIWVATATVAFWTVEGQEIANSFTYGGNTLANNPIDVFGDWLKRLVLSLVPVGFVAYLPAARLLGKPLPFGLPAAAGWSSPLVALLCAVAARQTWRFAVRHYRSTGS